MIEIDFPRLVKTIKDKYKVNVTTRGRAHVITRYKGLAYAVMRLHFEYTLQEIANAFEVDHTSVMYHVNRHKRLMDEVQYHDTYAFLVKEMGEPPILDVEEIKKTIRCISEMA
jgi:chromosomal replication initiation ATPase DnaA